MQTSEVRPKPPQGARVLEAGEIIQDGDLHWNEAVKRWVVITPQGEERVEAGQHGYYCRKSDE